MLITMEKQKDIFQGVVLFFCIDVIVNFFILFIRIIVPKVSLDLLVGTALITILYAATLYIVFGKLKRFPQVSILLFILIFILRYLTSNLYVFLPIDNLEELSHIDSIENIVDIIYTIVFAVMVYRFYRKSIREESEQAYIYYGMILIILVTAVSKIISYILLWCSYTLLPINYIIASILLLMFVSLFVFMFLQFSKETPVMNPFLLFALVVAAYFAPALLKYGDPYSSYKILEYGYIFTILLSISGFSYLLLVIISFVKYYLLRKTGVSQLGIKSLMTIAVVFFISIGVSYASNYFQQMSLSNGAFNKMKSEMPSILIDHFSDKSNYRSNANYSGSKYIGLIAYFKGASSMKEAEDRLNKGYLVKYEAGDPNLVCLDTDRIKEKLNAEKISYPYLMIGDKMYYPIPDFDFDENSSGLTICGLPSDFIIYVLEAKPEKLAEVSYSASILPEDWKNGYSKGICVSKQRKIVIYWGIAW